MLTYISKSGDVYYNLALEYRLALAYGKTSNILYLWSNDKAVVIGAHQIAAREANCQALFEEGGKLARRFSGGGAVYHDKHNLCFSFIGPQCGFSIDKNYGIILSALKVFGINACLSGRNDLEYGGKKFSGNAYYTKEGVTVHHGTLLIDTNVSAMARFLNADKEKLQGHGVQSVSKRVVNLKSVNKHITKTALIREIIAQAKGISAAFVKLSAEDKKEISLYRKQFGGEKWLFNFEKYGNSALKRFSWGNAEIHYEVAVGKIIKLKIYTDCLDTQEIERVEQELLGKNPLTLTDTGSGIYNDIISLFK